MLLVTYKINTKLRKKTKQKLINGGKVIGFPCSNNFFCTLDCQKGDVCAVLNGMGGANRDVIKNGQCCPA